MSDDDRCEPFSSCCCHPFALLSSWDEGAIPKHRSIYHIEERLGGPDGGERVGYRHRRRSAASVGAINASVPITNTFLTGMK